MTSREAFEASNITNRLSRSTLPGYTDEYADFYTQFAWRAWQLSERQALERAYDAAMSCDGALNNAGAVAMKIRALLETDK